MVWSKRRFQESEEGVNTRLILDIPYFCGNMQKAVAATLSHIEDRQPFAVFTPGATVAARAAKDGAFGAVLQKGDLILPDGSGCLFAARLCGTRLEERIAGIDFAEALFGEAEKYSARVFLYGGRAGVAERAAAHLRKKYKRLIFAAAHGYGEDPYERIAAFCPHIVCVCLGAGKQETWITDHKEAVGGVLIGLGGSLDVWAGDVRRAPALLRRVGLEWAYRTLREPRRLPRLFPLPRYFWKCLWTRRSSKCQKQKRKDAGSVKM